jgi:mannan endo-1,4-beta-mannosidase
MRPTFVLTLFTTLLFTTLLSSPAHSKTPDPLIQRTLFGAFVGIDPGNHHTTVLDKPSALGDYERRIGTNVQILSTFHGVGDIFPTPVEHQLGKNGERALLASLHMGSSSAFRFTAWSSGKHDQYLKRLGRALADYPFPIYLRPWPEMNADWVPFQPTKSGSRPAGGTPTEFKRAWRHVVDTVRGVGATNVRWVFNPTTDTYVETTHVADIFPGAAWVDVLGLDGYNWGTFPSWRSFQNIYTKQYQRLTALHPRLPVWVCEFGSTEPRVDDGAPVDPTHSKARWLRSAFGSTDFQRIQALVHFDVKKERDWRLASSKESLAATRVALSARPKPKTRRGIAGLGIAGLPPTLRFNQTGEKVVAWGRSQDPRTVKYQVQRRKPTQKRWRTVAARKGIQWVPDPSRGLSGKFRVRGLDAGGGVRWVGKSAGFGAVAPSGTEPKPRGQAIIKVKGSRLGKKATVQIKGLNSNAEGVKRTIQVKQRKTVKGLKSGRYKIAAKRITRNGRVSKATPRIRKVRVTRRNSPKAVFRYHLVTR